MDEERSPSEIPPEFDLTVYTSRVDYPLHIVTTRSREGELSGCVVGFVTQCSIVPSRFLVCISKVNHTYFTVERSDAIALHLIGRDQLDLLSLFAEETGDVVDKFSRCSWRDGVTGSPILDDCVVWLDCTIIDRWSVGDHEALLVRPVAGGSDGIGDLATIQNTPELHPGHPA